MSHINYAELFYAWDRTTEEEFIKHIKKLGWRQIAPVSNKCVFALGDRVLKFDHGYGYGWSGHTKCEAMQYARAKPGKKKYLAKRIAYHRGLLIQERLDTVCGLRCRCDKQVKKLAHKLRILDWLNHGYKDGRLKFFDVDSYGSGWYNWRAKQGKRS